MPSRYCFEIQGIREVKPDAVTALARLALMYETIELHTPAKRGEVQNVDRVFDRHAYTIIKGRNSLTDSTL